MHARGTALARVSLGGSLPRSSGVQRGWGSAAEVFRKVAQGFRLACRAGGARSVANVAGSRPGKRWRRWWLHIPARHEVRVRSRRGKERDGAGERVMVSSRCSRPSPLLPAIYPRSAGSAAREKERRQEEKAQQVRESGMGRNGDRRGFLERGWGFYVGSLAHGARCTLRAELDGEGGVSGWRCEPSLGVGVAVSMAQ
jgi:hypothetical protein